MSTYKSLSSPLQALSEMRRFEASLEEALGRDPTDEELALEMALPASEIAELRNTLLVRILPAPHLKPDYSRN